MTANKPISEKAVGLSSLIESTVTSLQSNVQCEKAQHIQESIEAHLRSFLNRLAEEEPLFRVTELIQVGSYAEGTKILQPDEFDFLAVVGDVSKPGTIVVDNNIENIQGYTNLPQTGYVTVALADDNLKSKWNKFCKNGLLQCFQNTDQGNTFGSAFVRVIKKIFKERAFVSNKGKFITISAKEIDFVNCALNLPRVNEVSLQLRRVQCKTPNVLIDFLADDLSASVDLSPAIRYHKIEDCFNAKDCASPELAKAITSRGSLLLVAHMNCDFRVTMTETEVNLMQTIMKKEHKIIYIFLKYINNLFTNENLKWEPFSSYMLKHICLHHDIKCHTELRSIESCLGNIIGDISEYCTHKEMPSAINTTYNVLLDHTGFDFNYRTHVIKALTEICQQGREIHTVEEFSELLKLIVNTNLQPFLDMVESVMHGKHI